MAHTTRFTFVAGDMTFTRSLPSRRLATRWGTHGGALVANALMR